MRHRLLRLTTLLISASLSGAGQGTPCATCHPKIAATYALTGMARSFYKPATFETGKYFHRESSTWYSMEVKDGRYLQKRWRVDADGREVEATETPVDYVMGSGNHVRTFLTRTDRGALVELPLAWYAENGGYWAMNPGHERPYALPPRMVAYECMGCHNAYPKIPAGHDEPGSEPLYAGALPEGIDCARCHGAGEPHVQKALAGAKPDEVRHAILNPSKLSRDRQMEVCYQCHLETTSQALPHSIQKFGRAPFSWNPAEPLGDYELFFDHAKGSKYENEFEIAHSAYRLRQSKCFLSSQMTCTTCHNPHAIPRGEEATAHYNGVCGQCHTAAFRQQVTAGKHTAENDCIACHMPKRRTSDVVHAVVTDHFIQRQLPAGDLLAPVAERHESASEKYRGAVVPYYPTPFPATPENALYLAVAQGSAVKLAAEVAKTKPARPEFYIELGQAWLTAKNPQNAVAAFEQAVQREPSSPVALLNLAEALTRAGQKAKALETLNRGIRANPDDALLWYQLGLAHSNAERLGEAAAALTKAVALDPLLADGWNLLGDAMASGGELPKAEEAFRGALRAEPDHLDALGNLGHLLAATNRPAEAVWYLDRAVALKPGDPEVLTNLAVTLATLGRFQEARVQAAAAVHANVKSADAHNLLGTLLERVNEPGAALREYLEAIRLRPNFGRAHLNAAMLLKAQGDSAGARQHLGLAANDADPAIRERAKSLLR